MKDTSPHIRSLCKDEIPAASQLVWRVFSEFEAPDYSPEGIEAFRALIAPEAMKNRFDQGAGQAWGAFRDEELTGVLVTRDQTHISLLFVERFCHRQGIAHTLFSHLCEYLRSGTDSGALRITVNSSPYAVEAYRRLGFAATGPECTTDGIRYTPMEYTL